MCPAQPPACWGGGQRGLGLSRSGGWRGGEHNTSFGAVGRGRGWGPPPGWWWGQPCLTHWKHPRGILLNVPTGQAWGHRPDPRHFGAEPRSRTCLFYDCYFSFGGVVGSGGVDSHSEGRFQVAAGSLGPGDVCSANSQASPGSPVQEGPGPLMATGTCSQPHPCCHAAGPPSPPAQSPCAPPQGPEASWDGGAGWGDSQGT